MKITEHEKIIVVTGASGYLGSTIVESLLKNEMYKVVGVVRERKNDSYYNFLRDLNGAKERLSLCYGDLYNANYDLIFKNAYSIIHVASPFIYTSDDPETDIIQAAVIGNLRVLNAAKNNNNTIKKVIITSSTAAVVDLEKRKPVYNENDWNESSKYSNPYSYSKYLAEKAIWEFKLKNQNNNLNFEIISCNPSFIIGPPIANSQSLNTSLQVFNNTLLGIGCDPKVTNRLHGIVDVRDVAKAHIQILESNKSGYSLRNLICNRVVSFDDMREQLRQIHPKYNMYYKSIIENNNNKNNNNDNNNNSNQRPHHYSIKSNSNLNLKLTDFNKTLIDTIQYLINNDHLKIK